MKIAVIGGGPAGMMAAIAAGMKDAEVVLFEKNEKLGKKLYLTGKGRCNITNACQISDFFPHIHRNPSFLYSSLYGFSNEDLLDLLHAAGLKTKVERGNRIFPASDKSSDVIKAFRFLLDRYRVEVKLNSEIQGLDKTTQGFSLQTNGQIRHFDKVIIATGGISYPKTGSTGWGLKIARQMGHTIHALKPALVPVEIREPWIKELQGVSLRNVQLSLILGQNTVASEFGEMLFTHFGLSGPIVLKLSQYIQDGRQNYLFVLDLKPALEPKQLENRLLKDFKKYLNKSIQNGLGDLLIQAMIPLVLKQASIESTKPVNQITKSERQALLTSIKGLRFHFSKLRPIAEAIITAGGVSTAEINPGTMESRIQPGLYFAGEMIDVDAETGGFNLQIAFSTGYSAGSHAAEPLH